MIRNKIDSIQDLLKEHHLLTHSLHGIQFLTLSQPDGFVFAQEALNHIIDQQTLLLLSGGRTPKEFYSMLAADEKIIPGAVGLVDERYGNPMHETSNGKMIADSGFTRYLQMRDIDYFPLLYSHPGIPHSGTIGSKNKDAIVSLQHDGNVREQVAARYDETLRELFQHYRHSIGILGIGLDGHTAGIPADPAVWEEFAIAKRGKTEYVIDYDDHGKFYGERITMTFLSLSMLDVIIVLCFGNDKRLSLEKMLSDGPEEEIPSRFYKRAEIAPKTIIITDQQL